MSDTVSKIRRLIGHVDDPKELVAIIKSAKERQELLFERLSEKSEAEAWARVKDLQRETTLYCCASGTFLGGPIQRGDSMTVYFIQPRKKIVWVTLKDGSRYWFSPKGINRYNLRTEPPVNPLSELERKFANTTGKIIAESLS